MEVFLNRIATAVPPHDIHRAFMAYAPSLLPPRAQSLFRRMSARAGIEHRYSVLPAGRDAGQLDGEDFYRPGRFPDTAARMRQYQKHALPLACHALDRLGLPEFAEQVTHLLVTSCTGFYAPGIDLEITRHYGLRPSVERSLIGFMGCYAAINALKLACHIVRSQPEARVVILNLELCTLHLQESAAIEPLLSFLIFADGAAASLVSAQPEGMALQGFHCALLPDTADQITWHIGQQGFDMMLSGQVPASLGRHLPALLPAILGEGSKERIRHWAIHPGGRSVLDAVEEAAGLTPADMETSRGILRDYGNMSSATLMFVLEKMLRQGRPGLGCAMAFGPGVTAETMRFEMRAA